MVDARCVEYSTLRGCCDGRLSPPQLIDRPSRLREVRKENRVSRGEPCGPLPGTPTPPRSPATQPCVQRGESPCDRTSVPAGGRAPGRRGTGDLRARLLQNRGFRGSEALGCNFATAPACQAAEVRRTIRHGRAQPTIATASQRGIFDIPRIDHATLFERRSFLD